MSEIVEQVKEKIKIDKEVIEVLPRNGVKKRRELIERIKEMQETYNKFIGTLYKEIQKRYDNIVNVTENPNIQIRQSEISDLDDLVIENEGKTSYEKMGLDELIYDINGYYKKNLEETNKNIYKCIKNFQNAGLNVTSEDFNISEYAEKYIKVLLEEETKGNINSEKIKSTFEEIYWQCSELIYHILVNIRCIYEKNEDIIKKYYEQKAEEIITTLNLTQQELENKKRNLIELYQEEKSIDKKIIIDNFFEDKLNINDYKLENYTNILTTLTSKDIKEMSKKERGEYNEIIKKLHSNLVEYYNYLQFKFISDEIIRIKDETTEEVKKIEEEQKKKKEKKDKKDKKGKNKPQKEQSEFDMAKIDIEILKKDIEKLNQELDKKEKKSIFAKKLSERELKNKALERDNKILKLKSSYEKLDELKFKNSIMQNVDDTSKILDVLKYASYNYGFLAKTIIKENNEIEANEIAQMISKFKEFVRLSDFSVLNNVTVYEKKDISIIIKDQYKLMGLNLSKEDFDEANLEDLIKKTEIVDNYNNIIKSGMTIDDIGYALSARKVLEK